jgi:hypothetical protein
VLKRFERRFPSLFPLPATAATVEAAGAALEAQERPAG